MQVLTRKTVITSKEIRHFFSTLIADHMTIGSSNNRIDFLLAKMSASRDSSLVIQELEALLKVYGLLYFYCLHFKYQLSQVSFLMSKATRLWKTIWTWGGGRCIGNLSLVRRNTRIRFLDGMVSSLLNVNNILVFNNQCFRYCMFIYSCAEDYIQSISFIMVEFAWPVH